MACYASVLGEVTEMGGVKGQVAGSRQQHKLPGKSEKKPHPYVLTLGAGSLFIFYTKHPLGS